MLEKTIKYMVLYQRNYRAVFGLGLGLGLHFQVWGGFGSDLVWPIYNSETTYCLEIIVRQASISTTHCAFLFYHKIQTSKFSITNH